MTAETKTQIKTYFQTGDKPSEAQFDNLIDSYIDTITYNGQPTTFTGQQNFGSTTLTDGATINWALASAQVASVTLGGNRTLAAPTNMVNGGTYILQVVQDGTGNRTLTFTSAAYKFPSGTQPVLSTAANSVDIVSFVCLSSVMYGVAQKGFA